MDTHIKVFVTDLDGTLTDGTYRVSEDGTVTKSFNTKDFHGLSKLQDLGVEVCIITGATDMCIEQQVKRLPKVAKSKLHVFSSIADKKSLVEEQILKDGITFDNVIYMGDDENDLECMKLAKITACPRDAILEIQEESNYISDNNGGHGAVRDFIDLLLKNKDIILGEKNES
jgi:3-deoxy-D-manno-octulosonate 8-phosphate phosphatase (KDO 8-P phosphatase)